MNLHQLTALFCMVDDFCKVFVQWEQAHLISKAGQRSRVVCRKFSKRKSHGRISEKKITPTKGENYHEQE